MKKNLTNAQLHEALNILERHNIPTFTQNIIGAPGETPDMFLDTVRMNAVHKTEGAMLSVFCPYPGTELYDICLQQGFLKQHDHGTAERTEAVIETQTFPSKRIHFYVANFQRLLACERKRLLDPDMKTLLDATLESQLSAIESSPAGKIAWGDLAGLKPVSETYGLDRGKSIDRRYIEHFLKQNSSDITGHCLEVLSDAYTRTYGASAVDKVNVLDVDPGNAATTIVTDLQNASCIPTIPTTASS